MKKIIVIEDEKPLLMAIKSKLEIEGYEVSVSEDGMRGEEMVMTGDFDLILLDIILPSKNGFEIMEDLKTAGNKIPILIISNSGQPVEVERATALGAKDFLIKADFTPAEVVEKVKKLIGPGEKNDIGHKKEDNKDDGAEEKENVATATADSGARVIIVEDDEFLRDVISQKLIKDGFDIDPVIDSIGLFESIKTKKPHIILLDLILPGLDGYQILEKLKQDPHTSDIPVLVLSNLGQKEDIDRALKGGAIDYLIKANFTPGEIIQKIRKILSEKYV